MGRPRALLWGGSPRKLNEAISSLQPYWMCLDPKSNTHSWDIAIWNDFALIFFLFGGEIFH